MNNRKTTAAPPEILSPGRIALSHPELSDAQSSFLMFLSCLYLTFDRYCQLAKNTQGLVVSAVDMDKLAGLRDELAAMVMEVQAKDGLIREGICELNHHVVFTFDSENNLQISAVNHLFTGSHSNILFGENKPRTND